MRRLPPPRAVARERLAPLIASRHAGLSVHRTHLAALRRLRPDVLLTQVQTGGGQLSLAEAEAACRRLLDRPSLRLVQLAAEGLGSAWADALAVANALGAREAGEALVLRSRLRLSALARDGPPARVAVLQWADPLYSAGGWTPALLRAAGCCDALGGDEGEAGGASLELQPAQLLAAQPQALLFAICGSGCEEAAAAAASLRRAMGEEAWRRLPAVRAGAVFALDATRLFSRAGPEELAATGCVPHAQRGSLY